MKKLKMYLVLYREKKNKIKVNKNKRKCDELMFYGENLEAIRLLNNKSRSDIAKELKVNEQTIWQYETDQLTPNLGEVFNLACIFNVQTQYFYSESPMIGQLGLVKKDSIFYSFNCQIKCNTLSLKSSAGVFQSNRLRGRVFNL